jgi:sulfoxide reductase heme-binding subunit YedZ
MALSKGRRRALWWTIFVGSAAPALYLGWQFWRAWNFRPSDLGRTRSRGWSTRPARRRSASLALTLAVTPVRQLTGWNWLAPFRRQLGLWMAFYATTHLATFYALDLEMQLGEVVAEIVKRPYITSASRRGCSCCRWWPRAPRGAIRRLGGKRWNRLHQLTYAGRGAGDGPLLLEPEEGPHRPAAVRARLRGAVRWRGWRAWQRRGGAVVPARG